MNILHVVSEVSPFSKTGGLGDVGGALPQALARHHFGKGVRPFVVSARYGSIDPGRFGLAKRLRKIDVHLGLGDKARTFQVEVYEGRLPQGSQVPIYLIEHPLFSERPGLYGPPDRPGEDYPDNPLRFALLSQAALCVARAFDLAPSVVHAHDWQTALALYYAKRGTALTDGLASAVPPAASAMPPAASAVLPGGHKRPATVLTIHNLSFQGPFPLSLAEELGIETAHLTHEGFEFYGQGSLLKGGMVFADRVTTVSPRYAQEIQTPEFGCGLDGLLRSLASKGRLSGILNGIDDERWGPFRDPYLAAPYGKPLPANLVETLPPDQLAAAFAESIAGKAQCKAALQRELSLPVRPKVPLCATISRLTEQKGIELILQVLESDEAWRTDMQYVIVGSGDRAYEDRLRALAARHPSKIAVFIGYDEALAHRVEAGADLYIMPSQFEPCGLNQMYSLRYGTIPVVRTVGGLADSVIDFEPRSKSGTGFQFAAYQADALLHTWRRALQAYNGDEATWQALMRRAMRVDSSWTAASRSYVSLYQQALAAHA